MCLVRTCTNQAFELNAMVYKKSINSNGALLKQSTTNGIFLAKQNRFFKNFTQNRKIVFFFSSLAQLFARAKTMLIVVDTGEKRVQHVHNEELWRMPQHLQQFGCWNSNESNTMKMKNWDWLYEWFNSQEKTKQNKTNLFFGILTKKYSNFQKFFSFSQHRLRVSTHRNDCISSTLQSYNDAIQQL